MKSDTWGVVVVRLQVPDLHAGHRYLLNTVSAIHKNVFVVIGETEARLTPDDPLTFEMRRDMLQAQYPHVKIGRLLDHPSDDMWSAQLDGLIRDVSFDQPTTWPTLYGGRDSFLSHYHGVHRTFELPPIAPVSGTEIREAIEPRSTTDFRRGMIYASKHKFPISYQCVDACIWRPSERGDEFLLGQKKSDNGKWRFVGGFVSPSDQSLEAAARREVREETGIEPGDVRYIGSTHIKDHRYPETGSDKLMSAFFMVSYSFGFSKAADDLDDCKWVSFEEIEPILADQHFPLYRLLVKERLNA